MAYIPLCRTNKIMRACEGVQSVNKKSILVTTKATELFIKLLVREGLKIAGTANILLYNDLVNAVASQSRFDFLELLIPKKITVREFKELMKQKKKTFSGEIEEFKDASASAKFNKSTSEASK